MPFWPDAAWRDVVFGAGVVLVVATLAIVVGPPELGKPPDPSILEAYPKPDWYFLWYFAALAFTPNQWETFVIVVAPMLFGAVLLLLPLFNTGERSVSRRPWAPLLVLMIVTVIVAFWAAGERAVVVAGLRREAAHGRSRAGHHGPGGAGCGALLLEGLRVLPPDRRAGGRARDPT